MLIAFLLILSPLKVLGESDKQDGFRKSRQLDLQDIHSGVEETTTSSLPALSSKDDVINGYLPPVSSSSPPEIASAQSQQAFDFKSINLLEKEAECKPSFDNCDSKQSFESDSKIPKPSRDLVPPFNDVEQALAIKSSSTTLEETNEERKTTIQQQRRVTTTTEKIVTRAIKKVPTVNSASFTTARKSKPEASKAESTNELRSYLPPQFDFSAAAQTNVAVVQPANQNRNHDHDHHHAHHHGDNFNICADAFHSFLCAPLKARKRITGALPESLKGQSSFINYQKSLFNPDRETAPSNTFKNEYLPPKSFPTNLIQSTFLPPLTTKKTIASTTTTPRPYSLPNILPEPSNSNDRFYLPPVSANKIPSTSFFKPAPSNQEYSTVKPSQTPTPTPTSTASVKTTSTTFAPNLLFQKATSKQSLTNLASPTGSVFSSVPLKENNFYLPPNPNTQSSVSFFSNSKNIFPISSTLSPLPSASFISTSKNIFPDISTLSPLPSTFGPLPAVSTFVPLSSNSIFISSKTKIQPTFPILTFTSGPSSSPPVFATTPTPFIQVSPFSSQPSNPVNAYIPPKIQPLIPSTTTLKPHTSTLGYNAQSSNTDRSYLPPDLKEPAAAQISSAAVAAPQVKNPFHHGRDLCTDPFHSFLCVSAKPRKRITGEIPLGLKQEGSNTDELRLKPEPSSQDENKVRPDKPLEGQPAQSLGYQYPKPVNPFSTPSNTITYSTALPSTGYSYPKPDKLFPLPSEQSVKSTTTRKPEPILNPSEARVVSGYEYPKPDKIFQPAGQENTKITTTSSPTTGYSYPKPQKPFPLPTEQKEIRQKIKQKTPSTFEPSASLPTNQVKGYQYPKPDQSLKLPEKKGYSYPKPEKRLELPTEGRSKSLLPQSNSNLDALKNLGSADFIPVNKIEYKRAEPSKLLMGMRRFGERMKKRERQAQLLKRQLH